LKDVKFVLTVKSCVLCDCFQHCVSLQQQLSCTVDWCCGLWIGLLYSYYLLIAERVKIIRWMFLLLTAGELKEAYNTTQYYKSWKVDVVYGCYRQSSLWRFSTDVDKLTTQVQVVISVIGLSVMTGRASGNLGTWGGFSWNINLVSAYTHQHYSIVTENRWRLYVDLFYCSYTSQT